MKAKKIIPYIPELYLLISVLYYWSLTASLFNPYAIGLLVLVVFQILTYNKITGILISSIFIILSFYMILAIIDELLEFTEFNSDAKTMVVIGFSYLIINIVMGCWMLIKYLTNQNKVIETTEVST